ncbi:glycoside hydrolase [Pterulicium gracile]|uniref:alpha-1,2-Mannosidase n=1 Tax=Pterulicium gracile TaxID=1884261 RepID=A0A5C3R1S2_9AGAR|nr:glycoside hydrolase [Pterula gracilis]
MQPTDTPSESRKATRKKPLSDSRKEKNVAESDHLVQTPVKDVTNSSGLATAAYSFVILTLGIWLYLKPNLATELIDSFLGLSDSDAVYVPVPSTFEAASERDWRADVPRRSAVLEAFKHAWGAYERDAMGSDEYHPISRQGTNLLEAGGIGYTVVDSIDTMLLMGLTEEYGRARSWVQTDMNLDRDGWLSNFETTIRVLGGLLSAYHLSGNDKLFLDKAVNLADRLLPAFETPSGLPFPRINLKTRQGGLDTEFNGLASTAEVATLQLEYRYLAHVTGDSKYWYTAEKVMATIRAAEMPTGLASIFMTLEDGRFIPSAIRLGSRGDSYYEYLLKQHLQTNRTETVYKGMYSRAMNGIHENLIHKGVDSGLLYTAELIPEQDREGNLSWRLTPKQDHLVCFLGGNLMLGAVTTGAHNGSVSVPPRMSELTEQGQRDWNTGVALVQTCMDTHDTATGLSPETVYFRIPSDELDTHGSVPHDWYIQGAKPGEPAPYGARYILRPETIESLFVAYRLTGDDRYRDYGWNIFQSIEKHCRVSTGGYASVINVDEVPVKLEDKMETFLLSETLKYLFLLFDAPHTLPLTDYVFNTEAHPLPIFSPNLQPKLQ